MERRGRFLSIEGEKMAKTKEDRRIEAIIDKVQDACRRAEAAAKAENVEMYAYWKGVAHGLNRGWDIHQGTCL